MKIKLFRFNFIANFIFLFLLVSLLFTVRASATTVDDYLNTGIDRYNQGEFEQSIPYFEKVIELQSDNWTALQYEAYAYSEMKNYKASADFAYKSLLINGNNPELLTFYNALRARLIADNQNNNSGLVLQSPDANGTTLNAQVVHPQSNSDLPIAQNVSEPSSIVPSEFKPQDVDTGKFIIQIQGGLSFPILEINSQTTDGEIMVGYTFDKNLTLGVLCGIQSYSSSVTSSSPDWTYTNTNSFSRVPLEVVAQFSVGNDKFKPYFLMGAGVCFDTYSGTEIETEIDYFTGSEVASYSYQYNNTETDLLLEPGIGLAYEAVKNFNVFLQSKLTIDWNPDETINYSNISLPVQLGCNLSI